MKNGIYQYEVTMKVPLGKRNGSLDFSVSENNLVGFLTMFTEKEPIIEGSCEGDRLTFSGKMKTLLNTFGYVATGTINQDQIELRFHTERGEYPATGRKVFMTKQENSHE